MDNQSTFPDPYEAVLSDLRRKRREIDNAIAVIEGVRGAPLSQPTPATAEIGDELEASQNGSPQGEPLRPGEFLGMTIADATRHLLARERRQMSNADVFAGLARGGLRLISKAPLNTIGSVLHRRFKDTGDIVRVSRGTWGLKEWYPGRSFKSASAKGGDDEGALTDEPSLPHIDGGGADGPKIVAVSGYDVSVSKETEH